MAEQSSRERSDSEIPNDPSYFTLTSSHGFRPMPVTAPLPEMMPPNFHPSPAMPFNSPFSLPSTGHQTRGRGRHNEAPPPSSQESSRKRSTKKGVIKRRITRACDQCHSLRTKCDGKQPCSHCQGQYVRSLRGSFSTDHLPELGIECQDLRERKKRGKASQKDKADRQATAGTTAPTTSVSSRGQSLPALHQGSSAMHPMGASNAPLWEDNNEGAMLLGDMSAHHLRPSGIQHSQHEHMHSAAGPMPFHAGHEGSQTRSLATGHGLDELGQLQQMPNIQGIGHPSRTLRGSPSSVSMHGYPLTFDQGDYSAGSSPLEGSPVSAQNPILSQLPRSHSVRSSVSGYSEVDGRFLNTQDQLQAPYAGRAGETSLLHSSTNSPVAGSSDWLSPHSPSSSSVGNFQALKARSALRYPVLEPALPWLSNTIPIALACDLLEHYFTDSSASTNPTLTEFHGRVIRKHSILRENRPRKCSPALLISMLCVAAHTSPSPFLGNPETRSRICHALFNRATACNQNAGRGAPTAGRSTQNEGYKVQGTLTADPIYSNQRYVGGTGNTRSSALDEVATFYHLALFSSYPEYGPDSLRWWDAAISLAKELGFGQELPLGAKSPRPRGQPGPSTRKPRSHSEILESTSGSTHWASHDLSQDEVTEEYREERRRTWWLLYIADRHLSLTLNRPAILADADCEGLLQPVDEHIWQFGDEYLGPAMIGDERGAQHFRPRGASFLIDSLSFFGLLSPLMTILGGIMTLRQALGSRPLAEWNQQASVVQSQLDGFQQSLSVQEIHINGVEYRHSRGNPSENLFQQAGPSHFSQSRVAIAYGYFLIHVLHLLLHGHWDPVLLLEDRDDWKSSPFFASATQQAVEAGWALDHIFEWDPDLRLMPDYLGTFILQGSFFFLYYSEKLAPRADDSIAGACKSFYRAMSSQRFKMNAHYQVRCGHPRSISTMTLITANSINTAVSCTQRIHDSAPKALRAMDSFRDDRRRLSCLCIGGPMGPRE